MKKSLFLTVILVVVISLLLTSCNELNSDNISDSVSEFSEISSVQTEDDISEQANPGDAFTDSSFNEVVYVKCCDASDIPNYESVYKFNKNGVMVYSINMNEGFNQGTAYYFMRKYRDSDGYEIWTADNEALDKAELFLTVSSSGVIASVSNAPCSFIKEAEFNAIYKYHTDWNDSITDWYDE